MDTTTASPSFLVASFQEFYLQVMRAKRRARGWREEEAAAAATPAERSPAAISQDLLTTLERQALAQRGTAGSLPGELFAEAQYVAAVLADEIFLDFDWPGGESWENHLLESRLFGTQRAGDLFFERLDRLLARSDPAYADLARVYLLALALGFEGKLRGRPEAAARLAAYRRRLFQLVFHRDPTFGEGGERLLPQAYVATLEEGSGERLPYLRPWLLAIAALLVVWIGASIPLWRNLIADLQPLLERILS